MSFTSDVDGMEGNCSSIPPTTYVMEDARENYEY